MAYTTPEEVRGVLSFTLDDPHTAAGDSDTQLIAAIQDAKVEIDAVLAVRYAAPFDDPDQAEKPVPPIVSRINRDMAAYLATLTFQRGAPMPADDPVALRYAAAQSLLQRIATGKVTLDLPGANDADQQVESRSGGATAISPYAGSMFRPAGFGIFPAQGGEGYQLGRPYPEDTY